MGGFNLGDIFASIKLDDSQCLKALDETGAASALLSIKVDNINGTVKRLGVELREAGFSLQGMQGKLNSLRRQGLDTTEAVDEITGSIHRLQTALVNLHVAQMEATPKAALSAQAEEANKAVELERQRIIALMTRAKVEDQFDKDSELRQKEMFARDLAEIKAKEMAEAEAAAQRLTIEEGASVRRQGILGAELANYEATYAAEVAAARLAAQATVAAERVAATERTALRRSLGQAAYIGGGRAGRASMLTLLNPPVAAAAATVIGLGVATKEAMDFDKAIVQSTANLRGMSDEMRDRLSKEALNLSTQFPIAAEKIAESFTHMRESGYDAQQSFVALPLFVKFASATMSDLDESIKNVTAAQRAFRLESSDQRTNLKSLAAVADEVVKLNEMGGESAVDFAKSLAAVGPEASKVGLNIRDAGVAVRVLSLQNIDGSRAGEVLSRVLIMLSSAAEKHRAEWQQLGLELYDSQNNLKPLSTIFDDLAKVIGTTDPKLNAFNTNLLGLTTRSDKFVAAFIRQSLEMRNGSSALDQMNGSLERVSKLRLDNTADQFHLLINGMKRDLITIGEPLEKFLGMLARFANNKLPLVNPYLVPWKLALGGGSKADNNASGSTAEDVKNTADMQARSAEAATEFVNKYSNSLPILRGELGETDKSLKLFYGLLSSPKISNDDRERLEPQYAALVSKRAEIQSRIDAINQKGADLVYRTNAALIDNQAKHSAAMTELHYKELAEITRLDEASIREKQKRQVEQINEELRINLEAINRKADLEKGKTGSRTNAELEGDRQAAIDQAQIRLQDLNNATEKEREAVKEKLKGFADNIRDMRAQYDNEMRLFSEADSSVIESMFSFAQAGVDAGLSENEIKDRIGSLKNFYGDLKKLIDATSALKHEFDSTLSKLDQTDKRELKQTVEFPDVRTRIPASLAATFPSDEEMQRLKSIDEALKMIGVESQRSLDLTVTKAQLAVKELIQLGASASDVKNAMKELQKAEDAAAGKSMKRWRDTVNEIGRDFRKLAGDFGNGLFDLLWPKSSNRTDPLAPLITAFRDAFDKLSAYADPKAALGKIVTSIKDAGTLAEANAIAIRYFGQAAGPQLARDIRSGVYSMDDLKKAIDTASLSTKDFEKQTNSSANTIGNLWRTLVRDITVMIAKQLIQAGIAELLKWMFKLKTDTHNLGEILVAVWNKVKDAIFGAGKAVSQVGAATGDIASAASASANAGNVVIDESGNAVKVGGTAASAGTNAGGGAASAASSGASAALGWVSAIGSVGTMISSIIGNFQAAKQETTLNAIEHNTRYLQIEAEKYFQSDEWQRQTELLVKFDMIASIVRDKFDTWGHIAEDGMNLLVSKFDQFVIPSLQNLQAVGVGGGNLTVNIQSMTVQGNDNPEAFVQQLKRLRVISGIS